MSDALSAQPAADTGVPPDSLRRGIGQAARGETEYLGTFSETSVVGGLEVAAWLHWCGAATPGDPTDTDNTSDGLPAPVCAGCRFEVPLHKAYADEVTVLYRRVEVA